MRMCNPVRVSPIGTGLALVCLLALGVSRCLATDTAFWKPYESDTGTFLLEHFDDGAAEGRFGKAMRGPEPWVQAQPQVLVAASAALEAWVHLDQLPKQRAYVIRREAPTLATRGFALYVEPDGTLGFSSTNHQGAGVNLRSKPAAVATGKWVHVAGLIAAVIAESYAVVYVDGVEVAREPVSGGQQLAHGGKETVATPVKVGEGVPGRVDEVRIHHNVHKLWPQPDDAWIQQRGSQPLPPLAKVLAEGSTPVLDLTFDAPVPAGPITVSAGKTMVDGVRGQAARGGVGIKGDLLSAEQGALAFWSRPVNVNNYSDRNVTLVGNSLFSFYLFNNARIYRALSLVYRHPSGGNVFANDTLHTDVYSGKWRHFVITWSGGRVRWYVDGRFAAENKAEFAQPKMTQLEFRSAFGDVDEVLVLSQPVSAEEAANLYWRYVDPSKLVPPPAPRLVDMQHWYLPTSGMLYVKLSAAQADLAGKPARLILRDERDREVFATPVRIGGKDEAAQSFTLPKLAGGRYRLSVAVAGRESPPALIDRKRFDWEGNDLGITDEVFPPFTAVKSQGNDVEVVLRKLKMNGFGLWDRVESVDEPVLAAPMRLVAVTGSGAEPAWTTKVERVSGKANRAEYRAEASCPAVKVTTTSQIECDGMMRVAMQLQPVPNAPAVERLSVEIPIRADAAWLLHEGTDHCRDNYAGALPEGEGQIWTSLDSLRVPSWLNAFTGYIWIGGPQRGIAWFADNDKGWITAKNFEKPLMRIVRHGDRVTLYVDLVNVPGVIREASELVFGVQASPTRPMPADFRSKNITFPGVGLPVHPWGGLSCSWKSPFNDDWRIVDKVIAGRRGEKPDREFFEQVQKQYDIPPVHGVKPWVDDVMMFAGRTVPEGRPDHIYFEEMAVLPFIPEYQVFKDEWALAQQTEAVAASLDVYRNAAGNNVNPNALVNFGRSYQDYTLSLMNEWWKRGVSIYWDNTYPNLSVNPWTSDAYVTEDGRIQPAQTQWNQRQYMQRTWNLMNHWRRQGVVRPLEFIAHMTNNNFLPMFTWATCNLDLELGQPHFARSFPDVYQPGDPFTPEFLLAETSGLQTGSVPYALHPVFQSTMPTEALGIAPDTVERQRREWGMRFVHEIIGSDPYGSYLPHAKALFTFGYGGDDVKVWHYWDRQPAFTISDPGVKGLLLTRARDRAMLLVLQSWSKQPVDVTVRFDAAKIGFAPASFVYDGFANRHDPIKDGVLAISLPMPYDVRLLQTTGRAPQGGVLFADDFNDSLNAGWDYLSSYAEVRDGRLRIGRNAASWMGHPRLMKFVNLPRFTDADLSLSFQIEQPAAGATVLSVRLPADDLPLSKYGLSHSSLAGGVGFSLIIERDGNWRWRADARRDDKPVRLGDKTLGAADAANHRLRISVSAAGQFTLVVDDQTVMTFAAPELSHGHGFQISGDRDPAATIGALWLDDVVLAAKTTDRTALDAALATARGHAAEAVNAQMDELKTEIQRQFGVRWSSDVYRLAMFRRPSDDVVQIIQRLKSETEAGRRKILLAVLRELPRRQDEHVAAMKAIGQPVHRLDDFRKARSAAVTMLGELKLPGLDKDVATTIEQLRAP